jgi:DNA-directed RNA polymerase subunit RPC12/RpoP
MLKGISTHVTCVRSHLLFVLHSGDTGSHTNRGLRTHVMCVISHSMIRVVWRDINACILDSSLAVCVTSPTAIRVVLNSIISTCMLKCNMKENYQRAHCEVHPFRCDVCNKSFAFRHDWKHHSEERPYHCDVCNVSFRYLKALTKRTFRHNNDYPYSCSLCGKGFSFQSDLTAHAWRCPYWRASLQHWCVKSIS